MLEGVVREKFPPLSTTEPRTSILSSGADAVTTRSAALLLQAEPAAAGRGRQLLGEVVGVLLRVEDRLIQTDREVRDCFREGEAISLFSGMHGT